MGGLGFGELLLIVLVLLFFFGAKRIPEIAKGIGGGIRSFKSEMKGEQPRLPEADQDSVPSQHQLPPDDPGAPRG
jgi:sec-independent protein translocase protein TatA